MVKKVKQQQDRTYQWNVVVDEDLDIAARIEAKLAKQSLSAWLRGVVLDRLDMQGGIPKPKPKPKK